MKINKYLFGLILLFICIGGWYFYMRQDNNEQKSTGQTSVGVQIGDKAPDFSLKTLDGRTLKLSDFRGKKVVLNFWATWCPPCKAEVPEFQEFYQKHQTSGIEIVAVDITSQEKNKEVVAEFIKSYAVTYPVVLDETGSVASVYRISAIPTTYMIDTQGIIRHKVTGAMNYQTLSEAAGRLQ